MRPSVGGYGVGSLGNGSGGGGWGGSGGEDIILIPYFSTGTPVSSPLSLSLSRYT